MCLVDRSGTDTTSNFANAFGKNSYPEDKENSPIIFSWASYSSSSSALITVHLEASHDPLVGSSNEELQTT